MPCAKALQRAAEYNQGPGTLVDIATIAVFGSYLKGADKVGDLDIAVKLRDRYARDDKWKDQVLDYAHGSGRSFPNYIAEFMVVSNRGISISEGQEAHNKDSAVGRFRGYGETKKLSLRNCIWRSRMTPAIMCDARDSVHQP